MSEFDVGPAQTEEFDVGPEDEFDIVDAGPAEQTDEFDIGTEEPEDGDFSIVGEAGRAILSGVRSALQDTLDLSRKPLEALDENFPTVARSIFRFEDDEPVKHELKEVERPTTTGGRITEALTEFATGFGLVGGAQRAAGIPRATSRIGQLVEATVKGAAAEQLVMDPHEQRLSNLIEQFPELQNPVTAFLAADEDETELEARLKMSLEGAGVGVALDSTIQGLRALRAMRKGAKPPEELPSQVSPEVAKTHEGTIDLSTDIEGAKRAGRIKDPGEGVTPLPDNLNTGRIETTDSVKSFLRETSEANDNFAPARRGVVSHAETRRLATAMGMTEEKLLKARGGKEILAHDALAARQHLVHSAEEVQQLAQAAREQASPQALFDFHQSLVKHVAIQEEVSRQTAEAGRLLNSYNIIAKGPTADRLKAIQEIADRQGGNIANAADMIAQMDTPEQVAKAAKALVEPRAIDKVMEIWINSLLSGPQTHAVNVASNALVAIWSIPEHLTAAAIGAFRRGSDKVHFREVTARTYGMVEGSKDGIIAFWKAIRDPDNVPMAWGTKIETRPNALGEGLGAKLVNVPGRFLGAEDRLFQAIGYRQELHTLAMNSGIKQGLDGRALARHIQDTINNPPESLRSAAIDAARYQTFTSPTGTLATGMSKFANEHPTARLFFPFIRTPTNILKFATERSPFGAFTKRYKEAIAKGGRSADLARSRMVLSSGTAAALVSYALEGRITGGGPSDPAHRAVWREKYAPYSIRIGDTWYSYQRFEPLSTILGTAADIAQTFNRPDVDEETKLQIAGKLTASIAKNLTSKTWLKGLSDTFEMLGDPDRYGQRWVNGYLGTVVPAAVAQWARVEEPMLKDVRTELDAIMARTPWTNENVQNQITIFGEPVVLEGGVGPDIISPIWTSRVKDNPVAEEMLRLKQTGVDAIARRVDRKIRGVELEAKDYTEFATEAGKASTRMAAALIKTPAYQALPDGMKGEQLKQTFLMARKLIRDMYAIKLDIPAKASAKRAEELTR